MNSLNRNLICVAAALLVGLGCSQLAFPLAWGSEGRLTSLDYSDGQLQVAVQGPVSRPQVEVQPGDSGEHTTAFLILTFPHAVADVASLQKTGDAVLLKHPELQRFLVSLPASAANAPPEGVEILLEFELSPKMANLASEISKSPSGGWLITVHPAPNPLSGENSATQALNSPLATPSGQDSAYPASLSLPERKADMPQVTQTNAIQQEQTSKRRQKSVLTPDEIALYQNVKELTADLQQVMNQRDALESQVVRLKQQLAEQERDETPVSASSSYIRPLDVQGNSPRMREAVTVQNLQLALTQISSRLKATEAALTTQTEKTRQLASEVAYLTHDPSLLNDPSLVVRPPDVSETAETTAQDVPQAMLAVSPMAANLPESAPDTINLADWRDEGLSAIASLQTSPPNRVYQAPSGTSSVSSASFKQREASLKTALQARPRDAKTALQLADLYASIHQLSRAEQVLLQFLTVQPDYKPGYYALALVYVGEKKNVQAQSALDTYRRLNPGDKEAIRSLQESIWGITQLSQTDVKP